MRRSIGQALSAIQSNPLRSGLAGLAIAVAVATMLAVSLALDGIQRYAAQTTARTFGADTFLIAQVAAPGRISRAELRDQLARHPPITRAESRLLAHYGGAITLYAPNAQARADVARGGRKIEDVPVTGTTASLALIRDLNLVSGRFFLPEEDVRGAQVAVIGADVADTLFADQSPIGQPIRIAGRRFDVIGMQGRIGSGGAGTLDQYVWIPIRTHERAFGAARTLQIFGHGDSGVTPQVAEDHARISLRAARSIAPGRDDNFDVLAPEAARGFVANLASRVGAAAGPISLMALLAAVVVVTNTVLVSVAQRTREIGVRRAIGATRRDIVQEVMAESIVLSLAGGAAGAFAIWAGVAIASDALPVRVSLSMIPVAIAFGAAAVSGLLAGWLPALRASRLDVVTAMRAE